MGWTAPGKSINGAPAPLAEDEDSDFGHESWYDRNNDKKRKAIGRHRGGKQGELRSLSGARGLADGNDERIANFNLLDLDFPSDESGRESVLDHDYSRTPSHRDIPVV